jgi:tetratricopeptide (TPR) repeat protein
MERCLVMCGQLWRFWHLRGHLREGSAIITGFLDDQRASAHTFGRAKALIGLAGLVYWRTLYDLARRYYEEALAIAREIGDESLEVETLYSLAYVRAIEADYDGAIRDFAQAQALYESQGNELMATWALEAIGMTETIRGRHDVAVATLDDGIHRFERLGDAFALRNAIAVESRALMHLNRLADARRQNRRVVELALSQGDITSLSASLHDAASLATLNGDLERSAILTGAGQRMVEQSGAQPPPELINRIEATPTLREKLDPDRLAQLLAEGRALSDEEAAALALSD